MTYKPKEKFAFYYIKQLLGSDFGKKPQISTTESSSAATPSTISLSLFVSPSLTSGPSTLAPTNTPIYLTYTLGTRPIYGIPILHISSTGFTSEAYIQPPKTGLSSVTHIPPGIGPPPTSYI